MTTTTHKIERHGRALAVNVKDRTLYAHAEPYASLIEQLPETTVSALYESTQADFWHSVGTLAAEYGYGDAYGAGRMSGWLEVVKPPTWDEYIGDDETEPASVSRIIELRVEIQNAYRHGSRDPQRQLCELASLEEDCYLYEIEAFQQRTQWLKFADEVRAEIEHQRAEFLQRLRDEVADLEARREAAIVRGEN